MVDNIRQEEKETLLDNNRITTKMAEEDTVTKLDDYQNIENKINGDRGSDVTILTTVAVTKEEFDAKENERILTTTTTLKHIESHQSSTKTPTKSPTTSLKHIENNNNVVCGELTDNNRNNIDAKDGITNSTVDTKTQNGDVKHQNGDVKYQSCCVIPDRKESVESLRGQDFPAEIETNHSEHLTLSCGHKNSISTTTDSLQCTIEIHHANDDDDDDDDINKDNNDDSGHQANSSRSDLYDTASLSEPCCRVCQSNSKEEALISPCLCSGSVKWIHESCLIKWMKCSLKDSCELCTKKIKITKQKKPFSKVRNHLVRRLLNVDLFTGI